MKIFVTLILGSSKGWYPTVESYIHIGIYKTKEEAVGEAIFTFKKKFANYSIEKIGTQEIPKNMIKYVSEHK